MIRLYLYVYAYRPTDSAAILDISQADTSADVADIFIRHLRKNVHEGIIRTYERKSEYGSSLRGRVDFARTYMNSLLQKRKYVKNHTVFIVGE